ncbi:DUF433 domain-containing protein [Devosia sp.]|uniref:DUF433 domain-containing protein n=1 Tax=Devosia sp. TaxID=1871048 RepID=UPI0027353765|nr:DUF433 domain-containing protein [Devosia sp.]MDP2780817.1 DUF433 domain-containing protein [Devosia sp.]
MKIVGTGTYTVADAASLSGVPATRIRRWLQGRTREYCGETVFDEALWTSQLPIIDNGLYLGFRDLIELRMVDAFRRQKLSLPYLRKVVQAARDIVGDSHPFSTSAFKTDGRRLYLEVLSKTEEPKLIEVLNGQHAFHSIVSVGLKDVKFTAGVASQWVPETGKGEVVIDPARSFGAPVLLRYGIPTRVISEANRNGRSSAQITSDYEVDLKAVRAALAFEGELVA